LSAGQQHVVHHCETSFQQKKSHINMALVQQFMHQHHAVNRVFAACIRVHHVIKQNKQQQQHVSWASGQCIWDSKTQ
jgi:hypothetical protein